jgi:hypothetical protein
MAKTDQREPSMLAHKSIDEDSRQNPESRVSRRQALIAGLAAAPAVLTLVRRPAWAQTTRVASAGICASLATASSLHAADTQLATDCDKLQSTSTTTP